MSITALIVDDEELAREELKYLLDTTGSVDVLAEGKNGGEAVELIRTHHPDVVFLDGTVRHAGEMFQRFGLLFLIDTGMSRGVDSGRGAVLHISQGSKATAVYADGMTAVLWE